MTLGDTERRYVCFRCRQPAPEPIFVKVPGQPRPEHFIGQYWRSDLGHAYCMDCLDDNLNRKPLELES